MKLFGLQVTRERRSSPLESPTNPLASAINSLFGWFTGSNPTASGELISESTALQHITVYACVRVLAESVGSLTLRLFDRLDQGRKEAKDDPTHRMLALQPNDEMPAYVFWGNVVGCLALCGNSYAEVERSTAGRPIGLYPMHPLKTEPIRLPDGTLAYRTTSGMGAGQARVIAAKDMLHFRLFSWDGLKGLSPIQQARQTIGLATATEKHGARYFGNGSKPGGILTPVGDIDEAGAMSFRSFWEQANGGENQQRVAVLPNEWKYTQLGLSNEDSQFLETQQMGRTNIAALFRVPPHMVGDTSRLSNNNHEQQSLAFVTDTLRPYLVAIEQELAIKLLPSDSSMFVQFDTSERLRGDFKTLMDGLAVGRQWGIFTTNYCLEQLGQNPIGPEGDVRWAPVNMTNAARLLDPTYQPPPQAATPPEPAKQTDKRKPAADQGDEGNDEA